MGTDIQPRECEALDRPRAASPGAIRRMGSAAGLATIGVLDLIALDDITTAGAWMPEIGFVIASIPALVVLAWFAFRRPRADLPAPPESD